MDMIRIKPVEGKSLPQEAQPRRRVTQVTTVPNTAYYRRAIARGDVALAEPVSTVANDETA